MDLGALGQQSRHSPTWRIDVGDCRELLAALPDESVSTVVTSPPYFGLRDYGHDGQIGLEPTPDDFVAELVAVFRAVRRVLRDDGTLWLNLGDSYAGSCGAQGHRETPAAISRNQIRNHPKRASNTGTIRQAGVKPKDLMGIPWMVAFALRADGWYLRSDIIWAKPNPMPESVTDRPTKAHEYLFLLSKGPRYHYDADAIREPATDVGIAREERARLSAYDVPGQTPQRREKNRTVRPGIDTNGGGQGSGTISWPADGRNKRSVWTVPTHPFPGAHFATFPPKLIEPCILAGSRLGDTILDPFAGAGTTGLVALRHGRSFVGIELNAEYADLARFRIRDDAPLLNGAAEVAA